MPKIFINTLKKQLQGNLPGSQAHRLMSPNVRFTGKLNPDQNSIRESGVLILLYKKNNVLHIPFIKRPQYNGAHSGQVSLPGGKYEPEDLNLMATALRETQEEIGINPDKIEILGQLTTIYIPNSNFNVSPFVGYLSENPIFHPNSIEVETIIEASLTQIIAPETIEYFEKIINDHTIKAPFFNINNHQIWGATAMIISELKEIIQNHKLTPSDFCSVHNAPKSR